MSLFKILKGDSSRISMDITPFHDGWCYFTIDDGKFYIDSEDNGEQKRTCINSSGPSGGSRAVNAVLTRDGWADGKQTIAVDGMAAEQNGWIGIDEEAEGFQLESVQDAQLSIYEQTEGALTVACSGEVPKVDIPVAIILLATIMPA